MPVQLSAAPAAISSTDSLYTGFRTPTDDAKPRVYWFWEYNRVDRAGITRDLEQFKAKGIGGVNLICTGGYAGAAPLPGVKYQSPEWWSLFRWAAHEAKRLNVELGFNLSAGGWVMEGPWVTPDDAMKKVVQSSVSVDGPMQFDDKLPQPEMVDGYYRDYCVQAFPQQSAGAPLNPRDIIDLTSKLQPDGHFDWTVPVGNWTILRTGYTLTGSRWYTYPRGDTFEGGDGYEVDALNSADLDDHFQRLGKPILAAVHQAGGRLAYFWSDSWESGKLTWTKNFPDQFRKYAGYDIKPFLPALPGAIQFMEYNATFRATAPMQTLSFVGTNLSGGDNTAFIDSVNIDGLTTSLSDSSFESPGIAPGSFQYSPTGGSWLFGGVPGNGSGIATNGSIFDNPTAPDGSQVAFVQGLGALSEPILGLIPGRSYKLTFYAAQRPANQQSFAVKLDDSVIGNFKPGTSATVIDDDVTTRFREDVDRTIQESVANSFYGRFAQLCHQNGVIMGSEAAGPNDIPPEDALKNLGRCDFPAGEFWVNGHYNAPGGFNSDPWLKLNLKQTASAAHVYGLPQAQAESFTQQEPNRTHWSLGPAELKPYANDAFCWGINRIMLHQATCQPPSDGKPGYEFCAGQHFNPNLTWWEQSPAFFTYLSRCSYMLQRGHFAADVCFYLGERPPTLAPPKYLVPTLGSGYDYDYCNSEVLIKRMSVKNGAIVLPDGMRYRLLVLQNCVSPSQDICNTVGSYQGLQVSSTPSTEMSYQVITKIRDLIVAGATIIGAPPTQAAGLRGYPHSDIQVRAVAEEIWGNLDGKARTERRLGKGYIIWGRTPRQVLLAEGVGPDCTFTDQSLHPEAADYIHRTSGNDDIYFVINRTNVIETKNFTFRVTGKQPEIFDPVSGSIRDAVAFSQTAGFTTVPLELDRFGSLFVVFRKPIAKKGSGKSTTNFPFLTPVENISGPWSVAFDPAWGGPPSALFPDLVSWTTRPEEGIKYYSGTAIYRRSFDLPAGTNGGNQRFYLDLGDVREVAVVRLNGKKLGVLWCFPWRVDITKAVKKRNNILQVDVINLWANRVIGDLNLSKVARYTKTHDVFRFDMLTKNTPLLDAGLLGPVTVLQTKELDNKR